MVQCGEALQTTVRIMVLGCKKIISLLITFTFLSFAIVNINDPDGLIWIFAYSFIASLPWIKIADQKLLMIKILNSYLLQ